MSKSILVIDTPKSCSKCKYQEHVNLDAGVLFGCSEKETIVYDTIGGMKFDRHPQCPLQPTELDNDIEELLERIENDDYIFNVSGKMMSKSSNTFEKDINKLKQHITTLQSKLDRIREIINEDEMFDTYVSKSHFKHAINSTLGDKDE